jgi:hypothetical protein
LGGEECGLFDFAADAAVGEARAAEDTGAVSAGVHLDGEGGQVECSGRGEEGTEGCAGGKDKGGDVRGTLADTPGDFVEVVGLFAVGAKEEEVARGGHGASAQRKPCSSRHTKAERRLCAGREILGMGLVTNIVRMPMPL